LTDWLNKFLLCFVSSCCFGMSLHWDKGDSTCWSYSDDQVLSIQTQCTFYLESQAPFIVIPSTVFSNINRVRFQQGEYNLNRKHIIIIEIHIAYVHVHLYSQVLNNNKTFYLHAPLFSNVNYFILNNFYWYLISLCIIVN